MVSLFFLLFAATVLRGWFDIVTESSRLARNIGFLFDCHQVSRVTCRSHEDIGYWFRVSFNWMDSFASLHRNNRGIRPPTFLSLSLPELTSSIGWGKIQNQPNHLLNVRFCNLFNAKAFRCFVSYVVASFPWPVSTRIFSSPVALYTFLVFIWVAN